MNRKGLTLIEIIIAIAILGLMSVAFLPMLSASFINLTNTKKLTKELLAAQQAAEKEMEIARNADTDEDDLTMDLFGKTIIGHDLNFVVQSDSGAGQGEINVFVPKYKIVYNVPEIASVLLQAYMSGSLISNPSYIFPLDSTISFRGTKVDGPQIDFLLNVYRWYMSPISIDPPSNFRDWIIIKEWNEAKTPLSYADSDDFAFVPNIEVNYDTLDFTRDFGFTDDEIAIRYGGRFFVYSVTPYSIIGRVGEEKFSNAISTNRINTIDPIYLTLEWITAGTFNINDDYSVLSANMLYGLPIDVPVVWDNPVIDLISPTQEEVIRYGTVVGYEDQVEFHLIINDLDPHNDPVAQTLSISGEDRAIVPTSGSSNYYYTYSAIDQYGNPIINVPVTWSLINAGSGVAIDAVGKVTITSAVVDPDSIFTVRAAVTADPSVYAEKEVQISKAYALNSSADTSVFPDDTNYTIVVKDFHGNGITGLTIDNISVNYVYTNSSSFETLQHLHDRSYVNVVSFIDYGDGTYTWTVHSTRFDRTRYDIASVRIYYIGASSVTIGSGLDVRYNN